MQKMSNIFMGVHKYIVITENQHLTSKEAIIYFFFFTYLLKTTFYQNMWDYSLFASFVGKVYFQWLKDNNFWNVSLPSILSIFMTFLLQILFISGLACVIGLERTFRFFFQWHKAKGSGAFFGGILVVLLGWPIIGMCVELYGFVVLFR